MCSDEYDGSPVELPDDTELRAADIMNVQLVGACDGSVIVILPRQRMSRREALIQAAWLVTIAECCDGDDDDARTEFERIIAQVRNT